MHPCLQGRGAALPASLHALPRGRLQGQGAALPAPDRGHNALRPIQLQLQAREEQGGREGAGARSGAKRAVQGKGGRDGEVRCLLRLCTHSRLTGRHGSRNVSWSPAAARRRWGPVGCCRSPPPPLHTFLDPAPAALLTPPHATKAPSRGPRAHTRQSTRMRPPPSPSRGAAPRHEEGEGRGNTAALKP